MSVTRFIRMRPPRVLAGEETSCWLAALRAWAEGLPCPAATRSEMSDRRHFEEYEFPDGSISERGLERIALALEMDSELGDARWLLRPPNLHRRLRTGYVFLSYSPSVTGEAGGHSVVAYGIDTGGVAVMDPAVGYLYRHFGYFSDCRRAFLGWPGGSWTRSSFPRIEVLGGRP